MVSRRASPPPTPLPLGFIGLTSFSKCSRNKKFSVVIKIFVSSSQEKVDCSRYDNSHCRFEPSFENVAVAGRKASKRSKRRRAELAFKNWTPFSKCHFQKVMYHNGLFLLLIFCFMYAFYFHVLRIEGCQACSFPRNGLNLAMMCIMLKSLRLWSYLSPSSVHVRNFILLCLFAEKKAYS